MKINLFRIGLMRGAVGQCEPNALAFAHCEIRHCFQILAVDWDRGVQNREIWTSNRPHSVADTRNPGNRAAVIKT